MYFLKQCRCRVGD